MGIEFVGVGFPNPLGEVTSPNDGYRATNCAAFSPEGQHVYRTHHTTNNPKPPEGRHLNREARKLEREQPKLDA